jgi:mRNA interferase RelE/StbE
MFKVVIEKQAIKNMKKFPKKEVIRIFDCIENKITIYPYPLNNNPKKLKNINVLRYRIGNYRILYIINDKTIFIVDIQHRKNIYSNLQSSFNFF